MSTTEHNIGVILFLLTLIIVAPMIGGATALAVSDIYLGKSASAGTVLSAAWRKVWELAWFAYLGLAGRK